MFSWGDKRLRVHRNEQLQFKYRVNWRYFRKKETYLFKMLKGLKVEMFWMLIGSALK